MFFLNLIQVHQFTCNPPRWSPLINRKGYSHHFFWANQRKADIKIFPWIQCKINKNGREWHIFRGQLKHISWIDDNIYYVWQHSSDFLIIWDTLTLNIPDTVPVRRVWKWKVWTCKTSCEIIKSFEASLGFCGAQNSDVNWDVSSSMRVLFSSDNETDLIHFDITQRCSNILIVFFSTRQSTYLVLESLQLVLKSNELHILLLQNRNIISISHLYGDKSPLWKDEGRIDLGFESYQCLSYIYRYVDWKALAAILVTKRSAGVVPGLNQRNPLHTSNKAHKQNSWL